MGYVYLVRNGDLFKIGRTDNLERRLKQLHPGHLIQSVQTDRSRDLEYELHTRFKNARIPQTEYFRLNEYQVEQVRIALGWTKPKPIPSIAEEPNEALQNQPEDEKKYNQRVSKSQESSQYIQPKTTYSNSDWYEKRDLNEKAL